MIELLQNECNLRLNLQETDIGSSVQSSPTLAKRNIVYFPEVILNIGGFVLGTAKRVGKPHSRIIHLSSFFSTVMYLVHTGVSCTNSLQDVHHWLFNNVPTVMCWFTRDCFNRLYTPAERVLVKEEVLHTVDHFYWEKHVVLLTIISYSGLNMHQ